MAIQYNAQIYFDSHRLKIETLANTIYWLHYKEYNYIKYIVQVLLYLELRWFKTILFKII